MSLEVYFCYKKCKVPTIKLKRNNYTVFCKCMFRIICEERIAENDFIEELHRDFFQSLV